MKTTDLTPAIIQRFESHIYQEPASGCWLWTKYTMPFGHGQMAMKISGIRKRVLTHRLAWLIKHGDFDLDKKVCHRCDVPQCVNPDHLYLGTQQENTADTKRRKRSTIGTKNPGAKLTEADVRQIRLLYRRPTRRFGHDGNAPELCKQFGINATNFHRIIRGEYWKHI